jgi:TATA-box binding protein (TBP) (component of TFIID and TFIIIB)
MTTYPSFDTLPPTTMTYVVNLSGHIDLEAVYELFPIANVQLKSTRKNVKNIKIPHFRGKEGSIYRINYRNNTRGIVKSDSKKFFKNSVLLDLGLVDKNVAVKISNTTFHITGVKEISNLTETIGYLMKYLREIQENLDYMKEHPEEVTIIDNWVLKNLKGDNNALNSMPNVTENLDLKILNFLTSYLPEFTNFDDYYTVFQWIIKGQTLITDLEVLDSKLIMTNYNYDLGFLINRDELAERLKNETDFTVIYDNSETYYIKVEYAYIRDETFSRIRKKPKTPKHTILIYKSGRVTQSGPGYELMKGCYDKFRTEIARLRPYIERKISLSDIESEEVIAIPEKKQPVLNLQKCETDFLDLGNLVII